MVYLSYRHRWSALFFALGDAEDGGFGIFVIGDKGCRIRTVLKSLRRLEMSPGGPFRHFS